MRSSIRELGISLSALMLVVVIVISPGRCEAQQKPVQWDDVTLRDAVKRSMENGCAYLRSVQQADGSHGGTDSLFNYRAGITALAVMAQINCDVPVNSPEVQKGLNFLRSLPAEGVRGRAGVYETSLVIMALCAADQLDRDLPRIQVYARLLEESQEVSGPGEGLWSYEIRQGGTGVTGDASNGQYAVLALRDAAFAGVRVSQETWQRIQDRWLRDQSSNGGWAYSDSDRKVRGSMTVAGISTIAITSRMLQADRDVDAQGRPDCCAIPPLSDALENGRRWLGARENFSVVTNPGHGDFYFYYLYGLERAGRLGGVRFFGRYDWYRLGAQQLVQSQRVEGNWLSPTGSDRDPVLNTSMALMFLSKGLSRVVINKLDYNSPNGESRDSGEWNRHPWDIVNLVDLIDTLPAWPPRLTSQVVTLSRLRAESAVEELNQAPILFISGREAPQLSDEHVSWLRNYVDAGGFIFAVANCDGQGFDGGFRELVKRMFPQGDASLQKLQGDHPVFRSEYLLNSEGINLWGVDFGCRTSIIYSPDDLGCLWQKWMKHEPEGRHPDLSQRILRGTRVGVNVVAYATGREPPEKLNEAITRAQDSTERIERGLLQIAKIRHTGGWDTAPRALRNLLISLNETIGVAASTRVEAIPPSLEELSRFPIAYMHGRYRFQLPAQQQESIREYLNRGGVLFADACCGSTQFDRSFRDLVRQLYPEQELKEIPADHELYSAVATSGHDIREVTRRRLIPGERNAAMNVRLEKGPPLLEGIEVDGRYAIIYSKYDISCALEHQASLSCDGYVEDDAARIAMNVVLYAMLQDIAWSQQIQPNQHGNSGNP